MFCKAGPLEFAKIIPPKDDTLMYAYGFVRFKTKADASHAIEMFKDYKLGDRYLNVRFSTGRAKDRNNNPASSAGAHLNAALPPRSVLVDDEDWEDAEKGSIRSQSRANSAIQPARGRSICRDAMATSSSRSDINYTSDELK